MLFSVGERLCFAADPPNNKKQESDRGRGLRQLSVNDRDRIERDVQVHVLPILSLMLMLSGMSNWGRERATARKNDLLQFNYYVASATADIVKIHNWGS